MRITIHQPEHMPWLGFLHKAAQADMLVLLDNVQFRKNYFQNRNRILGPNGPTWLRVPVCLRGHTGRTISQMQINEGTPWRRKWLSTLCQSYSGLPLWRKHKPFFEGLMDERGHSLSSLNEQIIRHMMRSFHIPTVIRTASSLVSTQARRSHLLREICEETGATTYLSGSHGRDYLDESIFAEAGIRVEYHEFEHPIYEQGGPFVPAMSAVDLLFRVGGLRGRDILFGGKLLA